MDIVYGIIIGIVFSIAVWVSLILLLIRRVKENKESSKTSYTIQVIRAVCNNTDHVVLYEETLLAEDGEEASKIVETKYRGLQPMADYSNVYMNVVMPDNTTTENNSNQCHP